MNTVSLRVKYFPYLIYRALLLWGLGTWQCFPLEKVIKHLGLSGRGSMLEKAPKEGQFLTFIRLSVLMLEWFGGCQLRRKPHQWVPGEEFLHIPETIEQNEPLDLWSLNEKRINPALEKRWLVLIQIKWKAWCFPEPSALKDADLDRVHQWPWPPWSLVGGRAHRALLPLFLQALLPNLMVDIHSNDFFTVTKNLSHGWLSTKHRDVYCPAGLTPFKQV